VLPQIQLIDDRLMDELIERAATVPRRRTNHNFHHGPSDNPHRFLNALMQGTYCAPHRHLVPPKCESFIVLRGQVTMFIFDDNGAVLQRYALGTNGLWGIDVAPGIWHTIAVTSATAVCHEVKPGPWDPTSDKEFAPWAPREGEPEAAEYLKQLLLR
jgi:cupin fold WbuC family metalloprotein